MGKLSGGFLWPFSFLIALVAVFWDFYESFFERKGGIKDNGKILPAWGRFRPVDPMFLGL